MESLSQAFHRIRCLKEEALESGLELRFAPVISRAFTPLLVVDTEKTDRELIVTLSLTSLYGLSGVLPDYFTDEILHEPSNGLKAFLDIFNHRQFELIFDIWAKHQFFAENTLDAQRAVNQQIDDVLLALGGTGMVEPADSPLFVRGLKRCLVGLFQQREKTPLGLKFLLNSFFGNLSMAIDQHIPTFRNIPSNQRTQLGTHTAQLGFWGNFLSGTRIQDTDGSFSLTIKDLDLETFYSFLPGGDSIKELTELIKTYTGNRWDCFMNLELKAEEIPTWKLGSMRLGSDTWALSQQAYEKACVSIGKIGGSGP